MQSFYCRSFSISLIFYTLSNSVVAYAQGPVVTARLPAVNAVAAPRTGPVQLTFSQSMSPQAATADAVRVVSAWRGLLPGAYAGGGSPTVTFTPARPFLPGEPIQVTATPSATASSGQALAAANNYQFSAAATGGTGRVFDVPDLVLARRPSGAALADVNGDGKLDLLTANSSTVGTVSVRLNTGQGTFAGPTDVPVGSGPSGLVVQDVNEDGRLDLLTANRLANSVSVRFGNAQGGFTGVTEVPVGDAPVGLAVGDANGDSYRDLFTISASAGTVSVRLGNGLGDFAPPRAPVSPEVTVGSNPSSVVVGDVNGDGRLDLLVARNANNGTIGTVSVRLGDGRGGFTGTGSIVVGKDPISLIAGDVNGDGRLDLPTANSNDYFNRGTVSVRLGDGSGSFSSAPDVSVSRDPSSVALGDVDGDGRPDLVTANRNFNYVNGSASVRLGDGRGGFAGFTDIPISLGPQSIALGDVDSDGRLDLLTTNTPSGGSEPIYTASVRLGDGRGRFTGVEDLVVGIGRHGTTQDLVDVAIGDVNNDGRLDVLTANAAASTVSVRLSDGTGTFAVAPEVPVAEAPTAVAVGDVNGDGRLDLLTASAGPAINSKNTVSVRLGDGRGGFAGTTEVPVSLQPLQVLLCDVNGDGRLDLLTPNYGGYTVSVRLGDGQGGFAGATEVAVNRHPARIAVGDVNGDGKPDLLVAEYPDTVAVFLGDGLGGFTLTTRIATVEAVSLTLGDVNGDGILDFATANYGYNFLASICLGDGHGKFKVTNILPVSTSGSRSQDVALADVNGDGHLDLMVASGEENSLKGTEGSMIVVSLGDGQGNFTGNGSVLTSAFPRRLAMGDMDNDGDLDFLATSYESGRVSIRLNGGTGVPAALATLPAQAPSTPVLQVFPNPAHQSVQVQGVPTSSPAHLFDTQGRLVRQFAASAAPLDVTGVAPGLYLLRCGGQSTRLVID